MTLENRQLCVINFDSDASPEVYVRVRYKPDITRIQHDRCLSPNSLLSVRFQRLKDEIADVTNEIESLGLTEER